MEDMGWQNTEHNIVFLSPGFRQHVTCGHQTKLRGDMYEVVVFKMVTVICNSLKYDAFITYEAARIVFY